MDAATSTSTGAGAVIRSHWLCPENDFADRFYVSDALAGRFPQHLKSRPFEVVRRRRRKRGRPRRVRARRLPVPPDVVPPRRHRRAALPQPWGRRLTARVPGRAGPSTDEWIEVPAGLDDDVTVG
ncbi:hypothetical protein [Nonomuraea sp. SYSU D8015]|uniref:hypothetical protein n=1 Tax=Nonomuraea sp. SYSU D8015 TaxID=2593644 RepID=UPI0016610CE2|nr:hypothetical protein [Nonomuraea sp. SYSU D8015]